MWLWMALALAGETLSVRLPVAEHAGRLALRDVALVEAPADIEACARGEDPSAGAQLMAVEITPDALRFAGRHLLDLEQGTPPEAAVRGSDIPVLRTSVAGALQARQRQIDAGCRLSVGHPAVLLVVDATVPFATLRDAMYSLGQGGVGRFHLAVHDPQPDADALPDAGRRDVALVVQEGGVVAPAPFGSPLLEPVAWDQLPRAIDQLASAQPDVPTAIVVPLPDMDTARVAELLDATRARFPVLIVAGGVADGAVAGLPAGPRRPAQALRLDLAGEVATLPMMLPAIGPVDPDDASPDGAIMLGSLDRKLIDDVIRKHIADIQNCYARELGRDGSARGQVKVKFVIDKDGRVTRHPEIEGMSDDLHACLAAEFLSMVFPRPKGDGIVIVTYPLKFAPAK